MAPPDHRPVLFLSSTVLDLAQFREVAIHVCQRLGIRLVTMEEFGPDPRTAAALCMEKVNSATLFLGLYAHRYGFAPDGFGGTSITQLEYEWAVARRPAPPPVLLFLIDEELPWPPKWIDDGVQKERLRALKAQLRNDHVVRTLTTPEQLREDLFVYLPRFLDKIGTSSPEPAIGLSIPSPPQPYVAHQYTLLQTAQVVGRDRELAELDGWVPKLDAPMDEPESPFAAARILCLVALGGMGKSALTWKWFHERAPQSMDPLSGQLWWSFYESDAGFDRFVTMALAYCTKRAPELLARYSPLDRERELLAVLDRQPFLLVLDGLERVLIAYANLDFAHLSDEDLDERTANQVAGARGLPEGANTSFLAQHRLRKTIDPRVGQFLRKLATVKASRVLVTTRLFPSELQTVTGREVPGTAAWFLRGLAPADALALWRAMGVSGIDTELARLFAAIEHYPLLIRALAGEVAGHRPAPGDFDRWRQAHPDFNPFTLPLVQVKSHVLAYALGNLGEQALRLLHTIAGFRAPVRYDTLRGLFVERGACTPQHLDAMLTELEDRGLLGWNRATNQYDLHPIVRNVVWSGLDELSRRDVYTALERHFSAVPASGERVDTPESAAPLIELFNALVGLGRYEDAAKLYFDRIERHSYFFAKAGMLHVQVALLESLFPRGLDRSSIEELSLVLAVYAELGFAYAAAGRLTDAYACSVEQLAASPNGNRVTAHIRLSETALPLGRLREALDHARLATSDEMLKFVPAQSPWADSPFGQQILCESLVGDIREALHRLYGRPLADSADVRRYEARICLWMGDYAQAASIAESYIPRGQRYMRIRMEMTIVLAEAQIHLRRVDEAVPALLKVLREARATGLVEPELDSLRCLAEAYQRSGKYALSRAALDDLVELAARGPYRLIQADAANVLARVELDCGNRGAAVAAAEDAYRYAWCDGPRYAYHWAFHKAIGMLKRLDAPLPKLS